MSIHASRVTKTIPIPFDPPHEATIQKLAGRHLQKAVDAFQARLYEDIRQKGGAQAIREMRDLIAQPAAAATVAAVKADPLNGFDRYTLVRSGLKAWTYADIPITEQAIDDLDAEAVDYFATEILRLTRPALFEDAEVAQKNA